MTLLIYYFWIAPQVLLLAIVVRLLTRGLARQRPVFFTYAVFEILRFILLFTITKLPNSSEAAYEWIAVCTLALVLFLRFGIVYEIGAGLLKASAPSLIRGLRSLMQWVAGMIMLAVTIGLAMEFRPGIRRIDGFFYFLDTMWSAVVCGLLLVLLVFTRIFHVSWRRLDAGIAMGLALFAAVNFASGAFRPELARHGNFVISLIQMATYHACVLVWLIYLFLPERPPKYTGTGLQDSDNNLKVWGQELRRMVQ